MKTKKLLLTALTAMAFASGLTACKGDDTITIGILQPVEHNALGAAREGFKAGVQEKMGDKKVEFKYLNAANDDANLQTFAASLVDDCDLTFGIGTGAAQALKNQSVSKGYEKPVIFSAVTDPVDAGLVTNKEAPEGFVTGTSDMNPVEDQIALIKEIIPDVSKIGIMYTQTEVNSVVQSNMAKAKAESMGLAVSIKTCTNSSDIISTANALVADGVQAIYLPTDNNVATNMNAVKSAADQGHVLVMCGEEGMLSAGGHVTLSINYSDLGKQAGIMAADIILGNKTVKESPVGFMTAAQCTYVMSSKNIADSGVTIPDSVKTAHTWSDVNA